MLNSVVSGRTVFVILEYDVGVVFSANSKTSRWQVEEPFVPGQGEDGQKREPPLSYLASRQGCI
jgi:hypothetical protein